MNAGAAKRKTAGYALMGAALLAYLSRPLSCGFALSQFTPEDPVPYARFDYHGWGVTFALLAALIFAVPVLWLASKVFLNPAARFGVFGRGPDARTTVLSVWVALALGAPMHSQLSYLIGLPISITAPVVASSFVWLIVVEVARTAAVRGSLFNKGAARIAIAVALLVTIPKAALIGFAVLHSSGTK